MISVIIPVYNESSTIDQVLQSVLRLKPAEVIVVNGKSTDNTAVRAAAYDVRLLETARCRSQQLNAGARAARQPVLLFLHADSHLSSAALCAIAESVKQGFVGGCFTQKIDARPFWFRSIEASGNIRARVFKVFYGDQAMFVRRDVFLELGGFDSVSLFEDVLFSKKLKKKGPTTVLKQHVIASARRWQAQGLAVATVINWIVSLGFLVGVPTHLMKKLYRDVR